MRQWLRDHVVAFHSKAESGDFRRSLWIRRPDTGWWVFWLEGWGHNVTSLRGRWRWLP